MSTSAAQGSHKQQLSNTQNIDGLMRRGEVLQLYRW